jgi:hypothetical protein
MPGGWISRLSIGQKLVLSFSLILLLLAGSLSAILFYLSRVNSYVERYQRITVPAVVTAFEILRNVSHMQTQMHHLLEHGQTADSLSLLSTISEIEEQTAGTLDIYRRSHAARTHPILFGMLRQHGWVDLADEEDQAIAVVADGLTRLAEQRRHIQLLLSQPTTSLEGVETVYEQTVTTIETAIIIVIGSDVFTRRLFFAREYP